MQNGAGIADASKKRAEEELLKLSIEKTSLAERDTASQKHFDDYCIRTGDLGAGIKLAEENKDDLILEKIGEDWYFWGDHYWQLAVMGEAEKNVEFIAQWYDSQAAQSGAQLDEALKKNDQALIASLKNRMRTCNRMAASLRTIRGRNNCLKFAATNYLNSLETSRELFDQHPWILPCPNGCVYLRTGELEPGRQEDLLTLASPIPFYDIFDASPLWDKFLLDSLGDMEKVEFFQRYMGYCITGLTTLAKVLILYGHGRNGKSVAMETIMYILGDLAGPIPVEMLLDQGRFVSASAPDAATLSLKGKRIAVGAETDDNRRIAASKVKHLSGSDTLIARGPHDRRMTRFTPTHKLIILTNHLPDAPMNDYAFWSRINVLPFEYSFVDRKPEAPHERRADPDLLEKLKKEAPGILAWLVRGCLKWQKDGLKAPESVKVATEDYRRSEDLMADFLEVCCLISPNEEESSSALYEAFKEWWTDNVSKKPLSQKKFGKILGQRFKRIKSSTIKYVGLRLLTKSLETMLDGSGSKRDH